MRFALEVNGQKICTYIADFRYEKENANGDWETIVEDAKGVETPEFKLKKEANEGVSWHRNIFI